MTGSPRSGSSHVAGSSAEAKAEAKAAGMPSGEIRGTIFNIERYAVHDGPGIRTLVFLKGCPLGCRWCQNPEGQSLRPELAVFPELCIGCGRCITWCPVGIDLTEEIVRIRGEAPAHVGSILHDCDRESGP